MSWIWSILADLFLIFVTAKIAGEVFDRLGQPAVIGELLGGILIGPHALGLLGKPDAAMIAHFHGDAAAAHEALELVYHTFAELGVIFLLFFVGLETRLGDLLRVGGRAAAVAVSGILLPFLLGWGLMTALGRPNLEALFVGTALVATSVGITARVLSDLGALAGREARIILGAAVIDDILAMIALAIVAGLGATGGLALGQIAVIAAMAIGFTVFVVLVGTRAIRRWSCHLEVLRLRNAPFVVAVATCLGLAALASYIGLAAIIGAFLAGMVFAEAREQYDIEHQALPVYDFLVPFFFVITGAQVDPRLLLDPGAIGLALVVTALAVAGKLIGCGVAAWGNGVRSAAIVGVGMVPRGEVGLIVAALGQSLGVVPNEIFSVIVIMSVLTTLVVPPLLKALYAGYGTPDPDQVAPAADPAR